MIGGEMCISCYNRQREFVIGSNAKGTRPTISLSPRHLGLIANYGRPGQQYLEVYDSMTHSTIEVIFKTLRTARVPVAFCLPLRRSRAVAVAELANLLSPPAAQRSA